jgi:hypothetical protein
MEITLYGCRIYDKDIPGRAALALLFRPWPAPPHQQDPNNRVRIEVRDEDAWIVIAPEGAELKSDSFGMQKVSCTIGPTRHDLTPNEVHALAQLKLHGFHFKE